MKNILFISLLSFLFLGCSTSYLTQSRNYSNSKRSYDKIAVIGVSKSHLARTQFEEEVVAKLQASGVHAVASIHSGISIPMEAEAFSDAQTEEINRLLLEAGFDGALVTNLVNTSQYTDVLPGTGYIGFYPVRYGRFGRYTAFYTIPYWEPDRMISGTRYVLESCLYALDNGKADNLQWVGLFELKDPRNLNTVTLKYASELSEALLRECVIPE